MNFKSRLKAKSISALQNNIGRHFLFFLNLVCSCVYLIWRFFFTIPLDFGLISLIAGVTLFIVEFFGLVEAMVHYYNLADIKSYTLPKVDPALLPDVDVFIATYNEPEDLLYKTVNGCLHMDYPDKSLVHIYLCDDGHRPEVKALAEKMKVGYFDREDNSHAKAGNLNCALARTTSPYVVTLDADMIPSHEFLMKTIPYFIHQEQLNVGVEPHKQKHIGFVQTPQAFYNPDLFQFNLFSEARIPNEQDYFYRDIQVARNKTNSAIYGGSNTVISRYALNDIGGFYTKSITEDYATGILMQKAGFICIALGEVLASGLSPNDLQSLVNQRIRWARGVIGTNRKLHTFLSPKLTVGQKVNYWASMIYWYSAIKRLTYFLSPIIYAVFGYIVLDCTLGEILLFWLPMYITSNVVLRRLTQSLRTTKWTGIYETVLFPFLLIPVILESFGITMKKFKVTNKNAAQNEMGKNLIFAIPFAVLTGLSIIGIINLISIILFTGSIGPVVVLFWLFINLFTLVMALFFVLGRNLLRKSERAFVNTHCTLKCGLSTYDCHTLDISETGFSASLDSPVYIDPNSTVEITIKTDRYSSTVQAKVVHVDERKNDWKYAFLITDFLEGYDEYLQIIYDRVPTLPQSLNKKSGSFDDLRINVTRRTVKPIFQNRALPRVNTDVLLQDDANRTWRMVDFNYHYCAIAHDEVLPAENELKLVLDKSADVVLECIFESKNTQGDALYRIENCDALHDDQKKYRILKDWATSVWKSAIETSSPADAPPKEKEFSEMDFV